MRNFCQAIDIQLMPKAEAAFLLYIPARSSSVSFRGFTKAVRAGNLPLEEADLSLLLGNALENCVKGASPLNERGYIETASAIPSCPNWPDSFFAKHGFNEDGVISLAPKSAGPIAKKTDIR